MSDPNYEYLETAIEEAIEHGDFDGAERLAENLEELRELDADDSQS